MYAGCLAGGFLNMVLRPLLLTEMRECLNLKWTRLLSDCDENWNVSKYLSKTHQYHILKKIHPLVEFLLVDTHHKANRHIFSNCRCKHASQMAQVKLKNYSVKYSIK